MLNDAWHALNECRAQARFCLFAYDNSDLRARYLQDPRFAGEAALNPLEFLHLAPNFYDGDARDVILGRKLAVKDMASRADGRYLLICGDFYSIIEISAGEVRYLWNDVPIAGGVF